MTQTFLVQTDFEEPVMEQFLSYLRLVEFDEDVAFLNRLEV